MDKKAAPRVYKEAKRIQHRSLTTLHLEPTLGPVPLHPFTIYQLPRVALIVSPLLAQQKELDKPTAVNGPVFGTFA